MIVFRRLQQSENEQVLESLRYINSTLRREAVRMKIEGAIIDAKVITLFLILVTVVRFFLVRSRRKRLASGAMPPG